MQHRRMDRFTRRLASARGGSRERAASAARARKTRSRGRAGRGGGLWHAQAEGRGCERSQRTSLALGPCAAAVEAARGCVSTPTAAGRRRRRGGTRTSRLLWRGVRGAAGRRRTTWRARLRAVSPGRIAADESAAGVARAERVIARAPRMRSASSSALPVVPRSASARGTRAQSRHRGLRDERPRWRRSASGRAPARGGAARAVSGLWACYGSTAPRRPRNTQRAPRAACSALPHGAGLGVVPDNAASLAAGLGAEASSSRRTARDPLLGSAPRLRPIAWLS